MKERAGFFNIPLRKRDGTIKGRAYVDEGPQRATVNKEDVASSTVTTESAFLTSLIAAWEKPGFVDITTYPVHL